MSRVAPPPAWPIPTHVTATSPDADQQRAEQDRRARQTAELRAQYPDAQPWYGERSGMWLAAPTGADRLISAPSAAALACELADHYRRMMSTPRPIQRSTTPRTGGSGAVARPHPATAAATASSSLGRHAHQPAGGRLRRGLVRLGLVAEAA